MRPVYNYIKEYLQRDIYPFHMPGHKRCRAFLPPELLGMEITEIDGADNLLEPSGIILQLEKQISHAFGADRSFITTNGATGGILAALTAVKKPGKPVLIARNCHKSVYSAIVVCDIVPVYIFPEITDINITGGLRPEAVSEALEKNPDISAVVLTSPTYEGFISDISAIVKIARGRGVPVIVDEAHGAHFNFSPEFAESAVRLGADVVVQSLHKMLPMFSQMAVVHVNKGLVSAEFVKRTLNLYQTTSPSYMLLAQTDCALSMLLENPGIMEQYITLLKDFRENYPKGTAVSLAGREYTGKSGIFAADIAKLLFTSGEYSGKEIERHFLRRGVQLEMSGSCHALGITTCADSPEGFGRLREAAAVFKPPGGLRAIKRPEIPPSMPAPVIALPPREAFYREARKAGLSEAIGRVSADFIIPYPPGIPIAAPGEVITDEVVSYIKLRGEKLVSVLRE